MSMVSHAAGSRFVELIGGVMTSFYDWYADLPVASPQVFGDQTDVPESGDWWDASYLVMWGSNVPITRTPDAHWMAEARYRGAKVVVVSPDYADNTKFADEWVRCAAGTDTALAMAMGHVILSECYVRNQVPFFVDYVRRYTDLPFLIKLEKRGDLLVPGKFLTAARKVGRLILVDELASEAGAQPKTAVYARVSSADQKSDLDRQVARVTSWATAEQIPVDKVVTEVGSVLNGHRRKFPAVLRDLSVTRIVVEHRDRFCRFGSEYVHAALAAQGRELVVVDSAEVDDDLVWDMTEILTSMCARLYGKRAAQNRAKRAVAAAAVDDHEAA
ncbi:IS607 family transposase [Mycobacterium tuberculosis]|nr:IS607 family transposase [Mycobacterium tuberculosis]